MTTTHKPHPVARLVALALLSTFVAAIGQLTPERAMRRPNRTNRKVTYSFEMED